MAAGRVAKIQLVADTGELSRKVEEAKRSLSEISRVKIEPLGERGRDSTLGKMNIHAKELSKNFGEMKQSLDDIGKSARDAFDLSRAHAYSKIVSRINKQLRAGAGYMAAGGGRGGVGMPSGGGGGEGVGSGVDPGEGGGGGGTLGRIVGSIRGNQWLRMLGISAGLGTAFALYRRQLGTANEMRGISAMSGQFGGAMGGNAFSREGLLVPAMGRSALGFNQQSRRARATGILSGLGRETSRADLLEQINQSERFETAYGISGQTYGAGVGALRRGGGANTMQGMRDALAYAVGAGLDGSRLSEFMESMAQGVERLSENGLVDTGFITGFASSLMKGSGFFSKDPRRAFNAMEQLNQTFMGGDRFQQAMVSRAIQGAAGRGLAPGAIETRRSLGIGFNYRTSPEMMGRLEEFGGAGKENLLAALKTSPQDILRSQFTESMRATQGMGMGFRAFDFMQRMGLKGQAGLDIFSKLLEGKDITGVDIEKGFGEDMQKRIAEASESSHMGIMKMSEMLDSRMDQMSQAIGGFASVAMGAFDVMSTLVPDQKTLVAAFDSAQTTWTNLTTAIDKLRESIDDIIPDFLKPEDKGAIKGIGGYHDRLPRYMALGGMRDNFGGSPILGKNF